MKPSSFITLILGAALTATTAAGCGSKKEADADPEATEQSAAEQTGSDDAAAKFPTKSDGTLDPSNVEADLLSPREAVKLLESCSRLCEAQRSAGRYREANETMRNFVDIYDIVASNHRTEFKKMVAATAATNADKGNLEEIYKQYQEKLSQYEGGGWGRSAAADSAAAPTDSAATPAPADLPPELRPAE